MLSMPSISLDVDLVWLLCAFWKKGLVGSGFSSVDSLGMTTSIFGFGFCDWVGMLCEVFVEL